ncbi:hypothetical protein TNCV_2906651 [Trichonephila clavipes]|nr:hypothetical protein TNCV_2906651 [Trichonephila clavipes]
MYKFYHLRDRGEGDVETDRSSDVISQKAQGESEVRESQAREENIKEEQSQGKRKRRSSGSSRTLQNELQYLELARREKRLSQEKKSLLKRSPLSSGQKDRSTKRRPQTKRIPRRGSSKEGLKSIGESSTVESKNPEVERNTNLYQLTNRASKRQEEPGSPIHLGTEQDQKGGKEKGQQQRAGRKQQGLTIFSDEQEIRVCLNSRKEIRDGEVHKGCQPEIGQRRGSQ